MKKIIKSLKYIYFALLFVFCLSPFWPARFWWLATLFQIAPLWVLFIPLYVFYISDGFRKKKGGTYVYLFFFFLISVVIMGFSFNFSFGGNKVRKPDDKSLRVVTANLGEGIDSQALFDFIDETKPDILLFQETGHNLLGEIRRAKMFDEWYVFFEGGLGVLSKFKIKKEEHKNRSSFGGWGTLIAKYDIELQSGLISIFNLHLYTLRDSLQSVIDRQANALKKMEKSTSMQEIESSFLSDWIFTKNPLLVAGDFNMRDVHPVYRKYWSRFSDAFSRAGFGFGYTKYTSWHGVRIDHVLYDADWKAIKAFIGPNLGGDHRPLVVDLEFVGEKKVAKKIKDVRLPAKDYFAIEQFETTLGRFEGSQYHEIKIDSGNTYLRGSSLRIQSLPTSKEISVAANLDNWNLSNYSTVSFSYRIPVDTPVALRVRTRFDDLICLGGTENAECPDSKVNSLVNLVNDDQWHEIDIDVKGLVGGVLPALKYLKEFHFYIHENRHLGDKFWIDDFRVHGE